MNYWHNKDNASNILGVRVDNFSQKEVLNKVEGFLDESKFHQITTINPEFILEAGKNAEFRSILNAADLNVADGIGIRWAFWRHGRHLKARIAGVDLMQEILKMAEEKNLKIFLAARKNGLSTWQETREAVLKKYPKLEVGGLDLNIKQNENPSIRPYKEGFEKEIFECDIVFCNFGAPSQEIFINSLKSENSARIRLVMGVGGSFDFLTGKVRRAPIFMRKAGLEWLWRLILQPSRRWRRICRAVIVFPVRVIFSR